MAGTLYTVALLYGLFVLKEVPARERSKEIVKKSFLADFFDFAHIRETILVATKARTNNKRMKILALMAVIIIVVGPQHGNVRIHYTETYQISYLIWSDLLDYPSLQLHQLFQ